MHGTFWWFWDPSGHFYVFWSGLGGDLAYLGGVLALVHHVNCHAKGCLRIGKHPVDGTAYKVCRKHHPDVPTNGATAAQIAQAATDA
jgi:hypothetical protein